MKKLLVVLLLSLIAEQSYAGFGGDKPRQDSLRRYRNTTDSLFIKKYPDRFIVTLSTSWRSYDMQFRQTLTEDTLGWGAPHMIPNLRQSSGLSIDFDKISFAFGIGTKAYTAADIQSRGETKYTSLGLSFSLYRFRFESSYRKYQGFYDLNTPAYDTLFDTTGVYYQDPDFSARSMRVKAIFIQNKRKFSYNSAFFNTQRQLKSAGSWLIVGSLYDNLFKTSESLIPDASQPFYGQYGKMNFAHLQGISIGPGFSYNLVIFKTLYFNLTATTGFDIQHRQFQTSDGSFTDKFWKIGAAGDLRGAFGLNGKRMFLSLTGRVDYNSYVSKGMTLETRFYAVDLNFGYRFRMRQGRAYKKLNENKWYQLI